MTMPNHFDFTLVVSGIDPMDDTFPNAVYEGGGSDATISSRSGVVHVSFSRKRPSLIEAIFSAIHEVEKANPKAQVVRVDDANLLNQAQMGVLVHKTRQMVNQYIAGKKGPGGFPAPACEFPNGKRLWDWSTASLWFFKAGILGMDRCKEAELIRAINNQLERRVLNTQNPKLLGEISKRLLPRAFTSSFSKPTLRSHPLKAGSKARSRLVG